MADEGPSLPSNYVTILHLKERWLKQQQSSAKPNPSPHESHSQLTVKPKHDSASKTPNESVHPRANRPRIINQLKPDVRPDNSASKTPNESDSNLTVKPKPDSASKTPNESVHPSRNRPPIISQHKPDVTPNDSASKTPNDSVHRRRNHHQTINQPKPEATVHDSASKTILQVAVEKHDHNSNQSNPKSSKTKNSSSKRNPRFVTDQIPTGGSTTLSEPEPEPEPKPKPKPVPEKKRHRNKGGRRNQNQEVREPESKTPPVASKLDDSSLNNGVVETVAAAVKETNITDMSRRTDRRWGSGGFHGGRRTGYTKPPFGVKKEQTTTTVWVRKGESSPPSF